MESASSGSNPIPPPGGAPPPPTGPPSSPVVLPPAGWYWDGASTRWWNGERWTEHVQSAGGGGLDSDDRTLAMISHAGVLVGGFILPLVMYLISNYERRPQTRHHAREALNFQLTFIAVYLGAMLVMFGGFFAGIVSGSGEPGGDQPLFLFAGFFLGFGAIFVLLVLNVVFSVIGAVRANRGERWQYPVRIPFVRG